MAIRPATANDAEAVRALTDASDPDYAARIDDGDVRVLTQDNMVVGVLVLTDRAEHLRIDAAIVDTAHAGKGFEKVMALFAEQEARNRGYDVLRVNVAGASAAALGVYRSLGFRDVGGSTWLEKVVL